MYKCSYRYITKEMLHAVKQAHSEYAAFLENEHKEALLQEEEQREQAKETARAAEKAKNDLLEQS